MTAPSDDAPVILVADDVPANVELLADQLHVLGYRTIAAEDGPSAQLQSLHQALHEHILTGKYETTASDLRGTLSHGNFNCLSSLAIYLDLCDAAGLPLQIWLARGHVFLRAALDGEGVVIEPGRPQWVIASSAARRQHLRQITPVELLAKFYYNRGVELLKERQFADGIALIEASLQLDPADRDARANLVAGLNNWAVEYLTTGRYSDAATLIEQGLLLDPSFVPLIANEQLIRAKARNRAVNGE